VVRRNVGSQLRRYARAEIMGLTRFVPAPVLVAGVRLIVEPDPARTVKGILDVDGAPCAPTSTRRGCCAAPLAAERRAGRDAV
jgi:hypothetical protein